MEQLASDSEHARIQLNKTEVLIVKHALNEICNGIAIDEREFPTRIGAKREDALPLLAELTRIFRSWPADNNHDET